MQSNSLNFYQLVSLIRNIQVIKNKADIWKLNSNLNTIKFHNELLIQKGQLHKIVRK